MHGPNRRIARIDMHFTNLVAALSCGIHQQGQPPASGEHFHSPSPFFSSRAPLSETSRSAVHDHRSPGPRGPMSQAVVLNKRQSTAAAGWRNHCGACIRIRASDPQLHESRKSYAPQDIADERSSWFAGSSSLDHFSLPSHGCFRAYRHEQSWNRCRCRRETDLPAASRATSKPTAMECRDRGPRNRTL